MHRKTHVKFNGDNFIGNATDPDLFDYYTQFAYPYFLDVSRGNETFNISIPIKNDSRMEDNEIIRIGVAPTSVPDGYERHTTDILIMDDDGKLLTNAKYILLFIVKNKFVSHKNNHVIHIEGKNCFNIEK